MMKRPAPSDGTSDFGNTARSVPLSIYRNMGEGSQNVNTNQGGQYTNTGSGAQYNANSIYFGTSESSSLGEDAKILKDLFTDPLAIPSIQREARKNQTGGYVDGTCDWILETDELNTWLNPEANNQASNSLPPNILWLYGNPGQGKSTIAAYLIDHLSARFENDTGKCLTYFLCDSQYEARSNIVSVMRGLLGHLFETCPQLLLKSIREKYRRLGNSLFSDFYHLWRLLMDVVTLQDDRRIFCIIDAIDECSREFQSMLYHQIQETFRQSSSQIKLSLLFLSRPYPEIRHQLGNFLNQDLASFPQLGQAIQKYIQHMIRELSEGKNYPSSTKEEIMDILDYKAEDTFLWVGFACQDLQTLSSWKAVKHLKGLPKGLDSLYTSLFESLLESSEEDMNIYQRILGVMAVVHRPLTLLELSDACQLDIAEDEETRLQFMRERIGDLQFFVVISRTHSNSDTTLFSDVTTEQVTFLHQSAKEFICNRFYAQYDKNEQRLHADLSYRCLDELIWHLPESTESARSSGHFLEYAYYDWTYHAQMAQKEFTLQSSHVKFFSANSPAFQAWVGEMGMNEVQEDCYFSTGPTISPLTVAAQFGLWTIIEDLFAMQQYESLLFKAVYPDGYTEDIAHDMDSMIEVESPIKSPLVDAIHSGSFETFSRLLKLGLPLTRLTLKKLESLEDSAEFIDLIVSERKEELLLRKDLHTDMVMTFDAKVLQVFLTDPRFELTDVVVKWAFWNPRITSQLVDMLVDRVGPDKVFSTENLEFAVEFGSLEGVASFFQQGRMISITNAHIINAMKSCISSTAKVTFLAAHRGDLCISEDTLISALSYMADDTEFWNAVFSIESSKIQLTEDVILEGLGVADPDLEKAWMLSLLLATRRPELQINESVIKAVIGNHWAWEDGIKLLHLYRGTDVGMAQDIFAVAAAELNLWRFHLIWDVFDAIDVDIKVIVATTKNLLYGSEIMELVINHVQTSFKIDESILQAAFVGSGCKLMAFLVRRKGLVALSHLCEYKTARVVETAKSLPQEKFLKVLTQWVTVRCDAMVKYRLGESDDVTIMETCEMIHNWNHNEKEGGKDEDKDEEEEGL